MHHIRRQILELELPREQGAAEMARRAGRLLQEKVLPELDKLFTRLAPADRILRIQRLEVDLSRISERRFEQEFVAECIRQITKQLKEIVVEMSPAGHVGKVEIADIGTNAVEVMCYFLQRGLLPWHAKGTPLADLTERVLAVIKDRPALIRENLNSILRSNRSALQRLVWQFPLTLVIALLETAFDLRPDSIVKALEVLERRMEVRLTPDKKAALLLTIPAVLKTGIFQKPASIETLTVWLREKTVRELIYPEASATAVAEMKVLLRQQEQIIDIPDRAEPFSAPDAEFSTPDNGPVRQAAKDPETPIQRNNKDREASARTEIPSPKPAAVVEGIPVDHAGLVLLTPYLSPFLGNLDVKPVKNQPESTYRAVHLLHYLACGAENPEESLLALPKILCGLQLEDPVPQVLALTDTERQECEHLLRAVIANWPALKNTSPDGLRSTFLQRTGLLSWSEDRRSFLLRMERKGEDLLLERLPWGYSIVKMGWMDWMINVEW